ncbi:MAG: hypothetical protein A4E57_03832 [Syntrophorhabdaceae bacterium PtaU1.Bin034]|nr:MAG: hypothetical protein A4E57_03832 [Syntrophorhabdaceae bacterium PtaU1.Bin034]
METDREPRISRYETDCFIEGLAACNQAHGGEQTPVARGRHRAIDRTGPAEIVGSDNEVLCARHRCLTQSESSMRARIDPILLLLMSAVTALFTLRCARDW